MSLQTMAAPARTRTSRRIRLAGVWLLSLCLLWSGSLGTAAAAGLSISRYNLRSFEVDQDGRGVSAIDLRMNGNLSHIAYYNAAQGQGGYYFPQEDFWYSYTLSQLQDQLDPASPVSIATRDRASGGVDVTFVGVSPDHSEICSITLSADLASSGSSQGSVSIAGGGGGGPLTPFDLVHAFLVAVADSRDMPYEIRGYFVGELLAVAFLVKDQLSLGLFAGAQSPVILAASAVLWVLGLCMSVNDRSNATNRAQADSGAADSVVNLLYANPGVLVIASRLNDQWSYSILDAAMDTDHITAWSLASSPSAATASVAVNGALISYTQPEAPGQAWRQSEVASSVDGKNATCLAADGRIYTAYRDAALGKLMLAVWDGREWTHHQIWDINELRDCRVQVGDDGKVHILAVERVDSQDKLQHYLVALPS